MRRSIVHEGAGKLTYEIREIVKIARKVSSLGQEVVWENIGDPVQKGEIVSSWIRDKVSERAQDSLSFGYTDSQGHLETRSFLSEIVNKRGTTKITMDDIIFFNGLGDAISKVYNYLKREARILGPSPAYSTHSSAEAAHSGYEHLTYSLDPKNNWFPDLEEMENKIKYNDSIAGILIINPDNPTGAVYPKWILESIVNLAEKYDLFIICDETYANVTFPNTEWTFLSDVIKNVPAISMRSLSKELPWPGARCGWAEVYNRHIDTEFSTYIDSIINAKRLEVCSTTLPQIVLPEILGDERYTTHLKVRANKFSNRADHAWKYFSKINGITSIKPSGGLYMTVIFNELSNQGVLQIKNQSVKSYIEEAVIGVPDDKRFVYYLLGATGICVVPLSGFYSGLKGFRFTLLEDDDDKRDWIYKTLAQSVQDYLNEI
ncbi:MAG: pyridoxal phosphate-dependent aminotransferase [Spirochaetales bacterium]|nr:pyridoxal phosphate-dependent aminotransferase [Spirochaetales bacterium]